MDWLEGLLQQITQEQSEGSLTSDFLAFIAEIDWSNRLFTFLWGLHLSYFLAVCFTAYKGRVGWIIFLAFVSFVASRSALYINNYFATQSRWKTILGLEANYFRDSSGAFISLVWSAPFVVSSFISVVILLFRLSVLLVKAKRLQLRRKKEG
eukprot:Gregarina_sp_Pseudo_9__5358@NODE_642_length_2433_cov_4_207602_g606_i0_p2_GENE_NODE_642_length_2433_cov_4_207602_g606_i0NODE_642_length_2433_cov_4_207602_g606_i0_p2_ORF_typecomplete_len152_score20_67TMEM18/PF14770_6/8_1e21DUF4118/PF13493_6/20_NODE_642_length_2433_cov_4_207602_g606_i017562211